MQKWNMIIDVAECTNCNLCTLATMDEYVDNSWPGYAAPMPRQQDAVGHLIRAGEMKRLIRGLQRRHHNREDRAAN